MSDTQEMQILRWLSQGYTLTALEALERFQCMALSQRIGSLKRKHHWPIQSEMIKLKSGKRCAMYSIPQARQNPIEIYDTSSIQEPESVV